MKKILFAVSFILALMFSGCGGGLLDSALKDLYDDADLDAKVKELYDELKDEVDSEINGNSSTTYTYSSSETNTSSDIIISGPSDSSPTLELNSTNITLSQGEIEDINFTITDDGNVSLSITSSDTNVSVAYLKADANNTISIQAINQGISEINVTVIDDDNNSISKIIDVNVTSNNTSSGNGEPTLDFNTTSFSMDINETVVVKIDANDTDGNITLLNIVPQSANTYANISQSKSAIDQNHVEANITIRAIVAGNFVLSATTMDDSNKTITNSITVTINTPDINTSNEDNPVSDINACKETNGYVKLTDNSFDPEGNYDTSSGIAIKSLYEMSFDPNDSSVTLYYKSNEVNISNPSNTNWNVFYDDHYETYYVSYTDDWINLSDPNAQIVYVQTPDSKCYRFSLDKEDISWETDLEQVTNVSN